MDDGKRPIGDILAALAFLDETALVTISVPVKDLRAALEARAGGPQVVTVEQAAHHLGRTVDFWRRAAKAGSISGAWQDKGRGPWRLPRAGCEALLRTMQHTARTTPGARRAVIPFDGGKARGPRRNDTPPSTAA